VRNVAQEFPDVQLEELIVDAAAALLIRSPERFDVIVTTNMFGDILSDLTAELSGSLGLGGSLNAGDQYAMGQAAHGSAPDIAGQDIANPFSLVLSAAMLLSWHARKTGRAAFQTAAQAMFDGVGAAIKAQEATRDVGGKLGTRETGRLLAQRIARAHDHDS
jgi:3-isopropylmalate dehydrogenase